MKVKTLLTNILAKAYKKAKYDYSKATCYYIVDPSNPNMVQGKVLNQKWWNGVLLAYMRLDKRYQTLQLCQNKGEVINNA